jgi:hypothetical protein
VDAEIEVQANVSSAPAPGCEIPCSPEVFFELIDPDDPSPS